MLRTVVEDIAIAPGEVRFVVRYIDVSEGPDGIQEVSVANPVRGMVPAGGDIAETLAVIDALRPDMPPIAEDDRSAIAAAVSTCPPAPAEVLTLDQAKARKRQSIDEQARLHNEEPFAWDFGDTPALDDNQAPAGPAGVQTLQVRGVIDEKNWLAAHAGAITAVLGGAPETVQPIKTSANLWVQTTALQVMQVLATGLPGSPSLLQRQHANLAWYGALKKACDEAEDEAALAAIDETAGWP